MLLLLLLLLPLRGEVNGRKVGGEELRGVCEGWSKSGSVGGGGEGEGSRIVRSLVEEAGSAGLLHHCCGCRKPGECAV